MVRVSERERERVDKRGLALHREGRLDEECKISGLEIEEGVCESV